MKEQDRDAYNRRREAERRADVVRRYVALDRPTEADTEAAAASLGLTVRRLYMLAQSWRIHGTTSLRLGKLRTDASARHAAAGAAEGALDLGAIREPHRAEIMRRIRIIGRYLRAAANDGANTEGFAAEYGVADNTFRRAVAVWIMTRDPAKLPGAIGFAATPRRTRSVGPGIETMVAAAIAELGPDASGVAVHRRAAQLCHAAGMEPPSRSVAYDRLLKARSGADRRKADIALCIDHVAVALPVEGGKATTFMLTLLFGASSGIVHEHRLDAEPPSARSDARLIEGYVRRSSPRPPVALLEMEAPPGGEWDELLRILQASGVNVRTSLPRGLHSARRAFATFGGQLGDLRLKRIPKGYLCEEHRDGAIPPSFLDLVANAVAVHNGASSIGYGPPIIGAASSVDLADRLAEFPGSPPLVESEP